MARKVKRRQIRTLKETSKWMHIGQGISADYFRISKYRGVKVFYDDYEESSDYHIKDEFKAQKLAAKTSYAPKPYAVVKIVLLDGSTRYGILMQHIIGKQLGALKAKQIKSLSKRLDVANVSDFLQQRLCKVGIYHDDLHSGNIVCRMKKGKITKIYAIDFSPNYLQISKV